MVAQLLGFAGVCILITIVPGLDTAMVTRNVIARGRSAGMLTAAGTSTGLFVHAVAVALGVSAILLRSAPAFMVLKICGAVYLGLLGAGALRATFGPAAPDEADHAGESPPAVPPGQRLSNPYVQGLVTNVTNPKAILFFLTFLPQFLGSGDAVVPKALALATIPVALNLVWFSGYVLLLDRFSAVLRRPAVRRLQERLLGVTFIGFGLRLALESR